MNFTNKINKSNETNDHNRNIYDNKTLFQFNSNDAKKLSEMYCTLINVNLFVSCICICLYLFVCFPLSLVHIIFISFNLFFLMKLF